MQMWFGRRYTLLKIKHFCRVQHNLVPYKLDQETIISLEPYSIDKHWVSTSVAQSVYSVFISVMNASYEIQDLWQL